MDQEILRVLKQIDEGISRLEHRLHGVQAELEHLSNLLVNCKDELVDALGQGK